MNRFGILLKNNDDNEISEGELANLTQVLKAKSENILRGLNEKLLTKENSEDNNKPSLAKMPTFFPSSKYREVAVLGNKFLFQS